MVEGRREREGERGKEEKEDRGKRKRVKEESSQ